jgi:cardiolipin synthase
VIFEPWREGNLVRLLENGEQYFPRVFRSIASAKSEILIEVFILFEDRVGRELQVQLIEAARRGVKVYLTVDGYGSADLSTAFINAMAVAGVNFHMFDPTPRMLGIRTGVFRRLHRKLVVIDGQKAFVGGINFSIEHLRQNGKISKQDYATEVEGPVVGDIRALMLRALEGIMGQRVWARYRRTPASTPSLLPPARGSMGAALAVRDNAEHRKDIEYVYRIGIRGARREIVIANAYFLPGYRFLKDLKNAARRGVSVHLILQGRPDQKWVKWAEWQLHRYLLEGGVRIHEYCERSLHGKVAVVDDEWSTVGSSNLDPLSLFLNLEANLVVRDTPFTAQLRASLIRLIQTECREITLESLRHGSLLRSLLSFMTFHVLRRLPVLAGWLPAHTTRRHVGSAVSPTSHSRIHGEPRPGP